MFNQIKMLSLCLLLVGCGHETKTNFIKLAEMECTIPQKGSVQFISNSPSDVQFFGDSHAAGYSSCDYTETDKLTVGYAIPLAKKLGRTIDNRAIGGSTTVSQLDQVQKYGTRFTALKVIMVGFNDVAVGTDLDLFKSNLTQVLTIMSANSNAVYIGNSPYFLNQKFPNVDVDLYNAATMQVINSLNLPNVFFVDVNSELNVDSLNTVDDKIHFNHAGSDQLSDIFLNEITKH